MHVAINPDSKYVYRNIAIHINVTCICIHICLNRSLKNPYSIYITRKAYIFTFINIASLSRSLKNPVSIRPYYK